MIKFEWTLQLLFYLLYGTYLYDLAIDFWPENQTCRLIIANEIGTVFNKNKSGRQNNLEYNQVLFYEIHELSYSNYDER